MQTTSGHVAAPPPAPDATPFERAIASRGAEYARTWLVKHGLRGRDLSRAVSTLEERLVEIVAAQSCEIVLLTLSDDGLSILATEDDAEAERWAALMFEGCRGQFGFHLPALAREVRRFFEGGCADACARH